MSWFDDAGHGSPVDVDALLDGQHVVAGLAAVVRAGALVSLGTTADGGALGVTVTLDGRWRREYFREVDPLIEWLTAAYKAVESEGPRPAGSSGRRKRRQDR